MKRFQVISALVLAFTFGAILGVSLGGWRQVTYTGTHSGANTDSKLGPSSGDHSSDPDRSAELAAENERLRAELSDLKRVELPISNTLSPEQKREYAGKLYEALSRRHGSGIDNEETRALMKHYHQLDSEATKVFVDRFVEKARNGKLDYVALDLIFKAGGTDASEFLTSRLNNPELTKAEREQLLLKSSGHLGTTNWLQSVPPTVGLESLASRLVTSADGLERAAGAGILGCFNSSTAQSALVNAINSEKDGRVLMSSVKSLARVGTADALHSLNALTQRMFADPAIFTGELQRAINGATVSIQLRLQDKK